MGVFLPRAWFIKIPHSWHSNPHFQTATCLCSSSKQGHMCERCSVASRVSSGRQSSKSTWGALFQGRVRRMHCKSLLSGTLKYPPNFLSLLRLSAHAEEARFDPFNIRLLPGTVPAAIQQGTPPGSVDCESFPARGQNPKEGKSPMYLIYLWVNNCCVLGQINSNYEFVIVWDFTS